MKILIFGAGGVGSVIGGFLARMGHEVSLLGRSWHVDAIEKNGLYISGLWGDYRIKAFDLYRSVDETKSKNPAFDLIVMTVKSYDTESAAKEISLLMKENTALLSFQNGLGNIETILKYVKPEQYLAGRVIFGVETEPGVVKVTVSADNIKIGALPGVETKMTAYSLARNFVLSKLEAEAVPNILTHVWSKVIYNCALNGICSLHEMPYGKILEDPETRRWMEEIVRECYAVGLKKKIVLDPPDAEGYIELLTNILIPRTAEHFPSMLQDLRKGKRTDIDALNGAICKLGMKLSVSTPGNQRVVKEIRARHSEAQSAEESQNEILRRPSDSSG